MISNILQWHAAGGWLAVLLGLLGFASSCDKNGGRDEYGTPSADYEVAGSVRLSGSVQPLAGVQVRMLAKNPDGTYRSNPYLPVTTTSQEGTFSVQEQLFPREEMIVPLEFSKQGEVLTDTLDVSFEGVPLSGAKGNWYEGKASKTIEVELDPSDASASAPHD